jgi:hypothetical protein
VDPAASFVFCHGFAPAGRRGDRLDGLAAVLLVVVGGIGWGLPLARRRMFSVTSGLRGLCRRTGGLFHADCAAQICCGDTPARAEP